MYVISYNSHQVCEVGSTTCLPVRRQSGLGSVPEVEIVVVEISPPLNSAALTTICPAGFLSMCDMFCHVVQDFWVTFFGWHIDTELSNIESYSKSYFLFYFVFPMNGSMFKCHSSTS